MHLDHALGRMKSGVVRGLTVLLLAIILPGCSSKSNPPTAQKSADDWTFAKISGDSQTVRASDTLQNRLVVQLNDGLGQPLFNQQIRFELVKGDGEVFAKPVAGAEVTEVLMPTDWLGKAGANFRNFAAGETLVTATVAAKPLLHVTFTVTGI
jgi:hypothetical protein